MRVPVAGNTVRVGSVPIDALDAEEIADLLGHAALVIGALAGHTDVEALNVELAPRPRSLTDLHMGLALAVADLDEAIETHTGVMPGGSTTGHTDI